MIYILLCVLFPGKYGRNCENTVDHCLSTPCYNGGACSNTPTGYTCQCGAGKCKIQSSLSYVTFQDNSEIWSYKTGDRLIQVHHEGK
jgi:hypothetical protein